MGKRVAITAGIVVAVLAVVLAGFFLFPQPSEDKPPMEQAPETNAPVNLGVTYLPISARVSAYYGLGMNSGALVTEVVPGSPAERVGVQVGDVILSFNGARLEEEAPLLGMMLACPAGHRIRMEVWRENSVRIVELFHSE